MLSAEAKQIKQVPEGFICKLPTYRKLYDWIDKKYIDDFKDWDDESILSMIRSENRLERRRRG